MTRKIFIGVVSVSLIIMLICAGLVTGILYDYMGEQLDGQLASEAVLVEEGWLTGGEDYLTGLEARTAMRRAYPTRWSRICVTTRKRQKTERLSVCP